MTDIPVQQMSGALLLGMRKRRVWDSARVSRVRRATAPLPAPARRHVTTRLNTQRHHPHVKCREILFGEAREINLLTSIYITFTD